MDFLRYFLFLAGVFQVAVCYRSRSHHCVSLTAPLCANLSLGYDSMMLPNFLRHDTAKEVKRELAQWSPLVGSGCHPLLKHFLCSVFAPVCMPKLIPPCRSLCSMVQRSCEPLMKRHNYTWPSALDCGNYPEDNMCVRIEAPSPTPSPTPASSVCADDSQSIQFDELQKKFCDSDFTFRGRVQERKIKDDWLILKTLPSKIIRGSLKRTHVHRLRIPLDKSSACGYVSKRKQFLIFGMKRGSRRLMVTSIVKWKDFRKFSRKLREKACRKI